MSRSVETDQMHTNMDILSNTLEILVYNKYASPDGNFTSIQEMDQEEDNYIKQE
jgi:hypothetical protein